MKHAVNKNKIRKNWIETTLTNLILLFVGKSSEQTRNAYHLLVKTYSIAVQRILFNFGFKQIIEQKACVSTLVPRLL